MSIRFRHNLSSPHSVLFCFHIHSTSLYRKIVITIIIFFLKCWLHLRHSTLNSFYKVLLRCGFDVWTLFNVKLASKRQNTAMFKKFSRKEERKTLCTDSDGCDANKERETDMRHLSSDPNLSLTSFSHHVYTGSTSQIHSPPTGILSSFMFSF